MLPSRTGKPGVVKRAAFAAVGLAAVTAGAVVALQPDSSQPPVRVAQVAGTVRVATQPTGDLKADIDAILSDKLLNGAKVGVVVRNAENGRTLYTRGAGTEVVPASNQKLPTTAAAFGILGAGHTFRTNVMTRAARSGATLRGDLVLKGTGDPTLQVKDYDALAAQIAAKGIKKVTGRLVADDTWFDARRSPSGWDPSDAPFSYAAQVSALTLSPDADFNAGSVAVEVTPGAEGQPVSVTTAPAVDYVKVDNKAVTGKAGSASTLSVTRRPGSNTLQVTGSYPAGGAKVRSLYSVHEPTLYAAAAFRRALEARGVAVGGETVRGAAPKGARTLAARKSMPLSQLAVPYLKLSNNNIAEVLVKAIGRKTTGKGTWAAGLPAVKRYVRRLGVDTSGLTLTDGSGLSNSNRSTPETIVRLLRAMRTKPWFPAYYNALPVAGKPEPWVGGTLAARMVGTAAEGNARAKTGTLTGATALSGYVKDPAGTPLTYSIIFNGYQAGASQVRPIQDKIVVRLAGGTSAQRLTIRAETGDQLIRTRPGAQLECSWTGTC